ncbi:MAG: hypothetical protein AAFW64_07415 [Pseudomonadota bacterium]
MSRRRFKIDAPAPRPTIWAAVLLAIYLSVPVFFVLTLVEMWWRGL